MHIHASNTEMIGFLMAFHNLREVYSKDNLPKNYAANGGDDEELDYETYGGEDSKCIDMFWIYYLIINIALLVATQGFDYFK